MDTLFIMICIHIVMLGVPVYCACVLYQIWQGLEMIQDELQY